jgi:ribosomal protein S18 acetylase RimI-like enzyme
MCEDLTVKIRALRKTDLVASLALWKRSEGIALTESDNVKTLAAFLVRNPGLSSAATVGGKLAGVVLCGHDGWRGFLYHLAVDAAHRRRGIAKKLCERSLAMLLKAGLRRCSIHVLADNGSGMEFWDHAGWTRRDNVKLMQFQLRRSP